MVGKAEEPSRGQMLTLEGKEDDATREGVRLVLACGSRFGARPRRLSRVGRRPKRRMRQ